MCASACLECSLMKLASRDRIRRFVLTSSRGCSRWKVTSVSSRCFTFEWLGQLSLTNAISLIDCARGRQPRYIVEDDNGKLHFMTRGRLVKSFLLVSLAAALGIPRICMAQGNSGGQSWTGSSRSEGYTSGLQSLRHL